GTDFDRVSDQVNILEEDEETRDDIINQRLGAESDDEAQQTGPGKKWHRVEPKRAKNKDGSAEVHSVAEGAPHERYHRRAPTALGFLEPLPREHPMANLEAAQFNDDASGE